MLSRAAERVYWAGRYLERAENTARIVQQHSQLLLDLPEEAGVGWYELIRIFGAEDAFDDDHNEQATHDFLLADTNNGTSLNFCIKMARDNIRNSRDLLPQESWENANELYQTVRKRLAQPMPGESRFEFLSDCIGRCQQINGILIGTMSHHSAYHFLTLGQRLERADMMSRIIDVAATYLQQNERLVLRYGSTLWTNVLKSVSGFQMYRQFCQPQVEGLMAIDFLLNDEAFPRAVRACMEEAKRTVAALPRNSNLVRELDRVENSLPSPLPEELDGARVSKLMDSLQKQLANVHTAVVKTWFLPANTA